MEDVSALRIKDAIVKYGPITDRFILRLDKETGEFEPWHLAADTYVMDLRGFLSCLQLLRDHEAVEEHTSQMRKTKSAAKRAAKADEKRLAKDAERVAKALAKATKKAAKVAEDLRIKTEKAAARAAKRETAALAKVAAKETAKAERAARKLSKAKRDDVPTYAVALNVTPGCVFPCEDPLCMFHGQAYAEQETAPETNEYAPWVRTTTGYVLPLSDTNTCTLQPLAGYPERWEIAAVIAGQKYRGTRDALADAFTAAGALVKSKAGTQVTQ